MPTDDLRNSDPADPMQIIESELKSFVEQIEGHEATIRDIRAGQKEIYAEAKGRGYDTRVIRRIIADRRKKQADVREFEYLLEMYRDAVGWRS